MDQTNELSHGHHIPVVTEHHAYGDYGHDAYGNPYRIEHFDLPQPKMPHVPVAHVPVRYEKPAHPLGKHHDHLLEDELRLAALLKPESHEAVLTKGPTYGSKEPKAGTYAHVDHQAMPGTKQVYPDQKPGPKTLQGEQVDLYRESYGP